MITREERRIALSDRVVVVDDDTAIRNGLMAMLREYGFNAYRSYVTGAEAKEAIDKDPPDLVILDLELPEVNGREVLRWIKETPKLRDIAVIVASAHLMTDISRAEMLDLGALYVVVKPFDFGYLASCVKRALATRQEMLGDGRTLFPSKIANRKHLNRLFQLTEKKVPIAYCFGDYQNFGAIARSRDVQADGLISGGAAIVDQIVRAEKDPLGFFAHAGDDFYFSFSPSRIPDVLNQICSEFDSFVEKSGTYLLNELKSGWFLGKSGRVTSIVSMPIGVASNLVFDNRYQPTGKTLTFPTAHSILETAKTETVSLKDRVSQRDKHNYKSYRQTRDQGGYWSIWALAQRVVVDPRDPGAEGNGEKHE